jgi:hypothetical protein
VSVVSVSPEGDGRLCFFLRFGQEITSGFRESWTVDAVVAKDFLLASSDGVVVRKTDYLEPGMNAFLEEQRSARLAQATVDAMLFHRDHSSRFEGGPTHCTLI